MDCFISAVAQLKASEDTKYDVIYLNTPWNKLSVEQMGKIDLSALTKDEALMYMWADTYTMQSAMELFKLQGFKFESVYQICDVATYPAPEPKMPKVEADGEKMSVTKMMDDGTAPPTPKDSENSETPVAPETSVKTVTKRTKKQRCPPLSLPPRGQPPSSSCSVARGIGM